MYVEEALQSCLNVDVLLQCSQAYLLNFKSRTRPAGSVLRMSSGLVLKGVWSHELIWDTRYLLATATFTPLYGRLCNVMGRRGANQLAVVFAALGTAACGFSTSMEMLIAARFVSET